MKILITGASGFVGSWICRVLAKEHQVTALIRAESSAYRLAGIPNLRISRSDEGSWTDDLKKMAPDALILSDWWGVENQYRNDEKQFANVARFKSIVDSAIASGVRHIIGIGSQAELGPVENRVYETQPDNPTTLYGQAKVEARKYLLERNSAEISTSWVRIFSTYGPLDSGDWLIPNTIKALLGNKVMDLTEGEQKWSYLYISDLAEAVLTCMSNRLSGIINCGNPESVTVRSVVLKIAELLGGEELLNFGAIPYRNDQVMFMSPVCESLTSAGWKPSISIDDGLYEVIQWLSGQETDSLVANKIPTVRQ